MARDNDGDDAFFWWDEWPRHGYDPTPRQVEHMWETFALAWEQGVRDPVTFFGALEELGFTIYGTDWDEWRDWYAA